ncbi:hypothetical protein RJ640_026793, partial [Escallonia rubra]
EMMAHQAKLNCGITIPNLGFGTYSFKNDRDTTELAIPMALKMGYRHFDTAKIYGSEPAVGTTLREVILYGRVERSDIFVTSKLWGSDHHDPISAVSTQANSKVIIFAGSCNAIPWEQNIYPVLLHEASTFSCCRTLEMEYVDVYLVHWPVKLKPWVACVVPKEDEFEPLDLETTGSGMEKCLEMGLCRGIGVELHPVWRQTKLRQFCGELGIHVSAYSSHGAPGDCWGSNAVVENPTIQSIALKHGATPAQVSHSSPITILILQSREF